MSEWQPFCKVLVRETELSLTLTWGGGRENLQQFGDPFHLEFEPTTETKRITFSVPFSAAYFRKIFPYPYEVQGPKWLFS